MNKKQLIVAWVMGILISTIFLVQLRSTVSMIVLIIGGLLIYTLRDKKK